VKREKIFFCTKIIFRQMINPPSNLSENIFSTTTAATGIVGPAYDRGDAGTLCRVLVSPKEVPARGVFRGVKVRGGVYHHLSE